MFSALRFRRHFAMLMIMAVFNMMAGNYFFQREFLDPLRELATSRTAACLADDSSAHGIGDHKPPKRSFVKHAFLCGSECPVIAYISSEAITFRDEPLRTVPDVYLEIIIPPKISPYSTSTFIA